FFFELALIAIVGQADVALEGLQRFWLQCWRGWWGIGWACVGGLRQNCQHQYKELPNSVRKTRQVSRALFHRAKFRHPQAVYRLFGTQIVVRMPIRCDARLIPIVPRG